MQTIKASVFKAKCLHLMDEVNETGEEIVITKKWKAGFQVGSLPGEGREFVWPAPGKSFMP